MRSFGTQAVEESHERVLGCRIARAERHTEFPLNAIDNNKVNAFSASQLGHLRRQQSLHERHGAEIVHRHHMLGHFKGRFLYARACRYLVLGREGCFFRVEEG